MKFNKLQFLIIGIILLLFVSSTLLWTTFKNQDVISETTSSEPEKGSEDSSEPLSTETINDETNRFEQLKNGNVTLTTDTLVNYGTISHCLFQADKKTLSLSLSLPDIPKSDDEFVYLFALNSYEDSMDSLVFQKEPIAYTEKATFCEFHWVFEKEQIFQYFVPALLLDDEYVALANGRYIDNPEQIATNTSAYSNNNSKKGLLIDPTMLGTPLLTDLDVAHAIYNIPLSHILGETADEAYPTISYEYEGKTYHFNGQAIMGYDNLFTYLTNLEMICTAVVLNDWNDNYPELIHPQARNQNSDAYYYAFNTAEEDGCKHLQAIASFLTERYSSGEHGLVSNWVIANEINQHKAWNYMDTEDISFYSSEYEKALRIFYNAAKSHYANAKVYLSIDHDWNNNDGRNDLFFNGLEILESVNSCALSRGNYDWGVAIHPYPDPLTRVNYWDQTYDKSIDAPILTLMNLRTITDFLGQENYLDTDGNVRSITVTELGFSSYSGEKLQAAAVAYCYYIIEANPYIEAFIMNRQTDAFEEVRNNLAFGIYEMDQSAKFLYEIYKNLDDEHENDNIQFMLNILGADSLEEALSWAQ